MLDEALERYPQIRAVVMTGFGGVAEAVAAIKRGAVDFLIKPFQLSQLARVLQTGLEQQRLREENAELQGAAAKASSGSRTSSAGTARCRRCSPTLELVSPMNSTVLIHGETGTGKELIARTIHHNSPRASERFVAFNAAAIPERLAEAELFGHVKGAFTGAIASRVGRFELAHRGTLFIDEVASMSLPLQAKLLRALQEREIERVGESRPMRLDIRVIAASNIDLRKMVKEGTFREDLFYRLNVIPVTLPALRQRREDIPLLAQHFVRKSCTDNGMPVKTVGAGDAARADGLRLAGQHPSVRERDRARRRDERRRKTEIGPEALPDDVRERAGSMLVPTVAIPDEGSELHVGRLATRARADPALPREDRRQQAPGGAAAQLEPHDVHRQAAPPESRARRSLTSTPSSNSQPLQLPSPNSVGSSWESGILISKSAAGRRISKHAPVSALSTSTFPHAARQLPRDGEPKPDGSSRDRVVTNGSNSDRPHGRIDARSVVGDPQHDPTCGPLHLDANRAALLDRPAPVRR